MKPVSPSVSVGMPTYNAERTIRLSIDSLLNQTLSDFELIVSDNASTDGTWAIVEEYARLDCRVKAIRQPHNIGANGNYSAVVRAARGRYFKWASSNDWCSADFLALCVAHLDANDDVVLVLPRTRLFQDEVENAIDYDGDVAFDERDAVERFFQVGTQLRLNNVLNGVIRTDALRATSLIEHYPGADVVLVGHLALLGKIALLHLHLFYRRMERETATRLMTAEAVERHHYPEKTLRSLFPAWRFAAGWLRVVIATHMPLRTKCRALYRALQFTYWNRKQLRHDLGEALRYPVRD